MYKCEECGANLDAGEKCDCQQEPNIIKQLTKVSDHVCDNLCKYADSVDFEIDGNFNKLWEQHCKECPVEKIK